MSKRTDMPLHLFHHGENFKSFETFGAHPTIKNGKRGYTFRVWAPKAVSVSVVGDFNGWDKDANPMNRMIDGETFELFIPALKRYDVYKYCIFTREGEYLFKADPYAFHAETPKVGCANASKLYDLKGYKWQDQAYMEKRAQTDVYHAPMNVYEVNLLSWKRKPNGDYLTYKELAKELVSYVKKMGYTHVEFMPVMEHPFDGSWGYQVTGYYAVTSRLGTPHDFMALIDAFHKAGIGVILDWVPAHFPKDGFGLYEFDGGSLYEASQWDRKENRGGGTRHFDFGRKEVLSFLISNAVFYFEKYHVDGLRVDAVASMLYLDYDKEAGEWVPNVYGENKNLEALAFLRRLNETVFNYFPSALMIAEESSAWPMMTKPTNLGGIGFNFKWNMGWMNDLLDYVETDPLYRKYEHNKLTFSLMYAFSENYVLPISHDEVVHGKKSFVDKMPGCYEDKFAGARAFLGYMMAPPGQKLTFMSNEIAQFREWDYENGVEFFLTDYPMHAKYAAYTREINEFYKNTPAFYEVDDSWNGFEWLAPDDGDRNFLAFSRIDKNGGKVVAIFNFSGADLYGYRLGLEKGKYQIVFNSDSVRYGGTGRFKKRVFNTEKIYSHGKDYSIGFDLPKLTCMYLKKISD